MDVGYVIPSLNKSGWRGSLRDGINFLMGVMEAYQVFENAERAQQTQNWQNGQGEQQGNVFLSVLDEMKMTMDHGNLEQTIPDTGPAIIVANHPFGGADAIALSGLCISKRPDTRVLANAITAELPGTEKWTIPLQILGEDGATHSNRAAMKESLSLLRAGGILIVFPAGAVSRWRTDLGRVADPTWTGHVARLSTKTGAPVLPVRFFGKNPAWFEILGVIHPILRSALIVRVFLAARGQCLRFCAGPMIEADTLREQKAADKMTEFIRMAVESIPEP